jgi:hypothetical protein
MIQAYICTYLSTVSTTSSISPSISICISLHLHHLSSRLLDLLLWNTSAWISTTIHNWYIYCYVYVASTPSYKNKRELNLISDATHTSLPQLCRHVKQHKVPAPPLSDLLQQWSLHCIPLHSRNRKPPMYMSHHSSACTTKEYDKSYVPSPWICVHLSIYHHHACVHLPCSVSCSNKPSQRLFRISYASEHGRPITLDPSSVGSSITSPSRTSVSIALSIGISIYKQIQTLQLFTSHAKPWEQKQCSYRLPPLPWISRT